MHATLTALDPATEDADPGVGRRPRRGRLSEAAPGLVGLCVLVVATVVIGVVAADERAAATEVLRSSDARLADAEAILLGSLEALSAVEADAAAGWDAASALQAAIRPDLLADAATAAALGDASAQLEETAGLIVDQGSASAPASETVPSSEPVALHRVPWLILESAAAQDTRSADLSRRAAQVDADAIAVADARDAVDAAAEAALSSAAVFGAARSGVEKADTAHSDALAAAVAALSDTTAPAVDRFTAFAAAWDAAKVSHDETIAAEQAAAAAAAAQRIVRPTVTTKPPTRTTFTIPPDLGKIEIIPATFEVGPGFVPWHEGCRWDIMDNVGKGGHSTHGLSLAAQGRAWSAQVLGMSVQYYVC